MIKIWFFDSERVIDFDQKSHKSCNRVKLAKDEINRSFTNTWKTVNDVNGRKTSNRCIEQIWPALVIRDRQKNEPQIAKKNWTTKWLKMKSWSFGIMGGKNLIFRFWESYLILIRNLINPVIGSNWLKMKKWMLRKNLINRSFANT